MANRSNNDKPLLVMLQNQVTLDTSHFITLAILVTVHHANILTNFMWARNENSSNINVRLFFFKITPTGMTLTFVTA